MLLSNLRNRLYKSNLRRVAKIRQHIRVKINKKSVREYPIDCMQNMCICDLKNGETVGKIITVYRKKFQYADVLMEFINNVDAFNYEQGVRHSIFYIDNNFIYRDGVETFKSKILKRKYKQHLKDQTITRKLRFNGKIGREYNEQW